MTAFNSTILTDAINIARISTEQTANSLATKDIDGATAKQIRPEIIAAGGKVRGLSSTIIRDIDETKLSWIRTATSKSEYYNIIDKSIGNINSNLDMLEENTAPGFTAQLNRFFEAVRGLTTLKSDETSKALTVNRADELASKINNIVSVVKNERIQASESLERRLVEFNQILKNIYELNIKIFNVNMKNLDSSGLEDMRDQFLNKASSYMEIKVSFDSNKIALVRTGQFDLVLPTNYANLTYEDEITDFSNDNSIKPIYIEMHDSMGVPSGYRQQFYNSKFKNLSNIGFGVIKGHIDLIENMLPKYNNMLNSATYNIANQINKVHNRGSSYDGREEVRGTKETKLNSTTSWNGSVKIALTDSEGRPITDAEDKILAPLDLNLGKLSNCRPNGTVSMKDIINEINAYYSPSQGLMSSMGPQGSNPGKNLLNDFRLIVNSSNSNYLSLDFEAQNSSDISTKLQIIDFNIVGSTSSKTKLPDTVDVPSNTKFRTFQTCGIETNGLTGSHQIEVKIRVIGENGDIKNGVIRFDIDLDNLPLDSTRISGTPVGGGDFLPQTRSNFSKFLQTDLVNTNGLVVSSNGENGFLQLKVLNDNHRIHIEDDTSYQNSPLNLRENGRGFSHYFGLNNFFEIDNNPSLYAKNFRVSQFIKENNALVSTAKLSSNSQVTDNYTLGTSKAKTEIYFNSAATIPTDFLNSTITVFNKTFTLSGSNGEGLINISSASSIADVTALIASALNADTNLNTILEFTSDTELLTFTAKNAGTSSNSINVSLASSGASLYSTTNSGFLANTGNIALTGGANNVLQQTKFINGYYVYESSSQLAAELARVGELSFKMIGNKDISSVTSNIIDYSVFVGSEMFRVKSDNESLLNINKDTLTNLYTSYKTDHQMNEDKAMPLLMEYQQMFRMLSIAYRNCLELNDIFLGVLR